MTNLVTLTTATMIVVTNWISVGTFTDKAGRPYDVIQGVVQTNTVGRMEMDGQTVEHVFKSVTGPTNETFKLVPILNSGMFPGTNPPPLQINAHFVYPTEVVGTVSTNR